MRIVVTGGLGYIGSLLVARLEPEVRGGMLVIDNRSMQGSASSFLPATAIIDNDIRTATLDRVIAGADVVVHLAAIVGANESEHRDPSLLESVNVDGTRRVAEACVRTGARLVFPSTTSVYGSAREVIDECAREEPRPETPYAATKLLAERALETLGRKGLQYAVLRFGTAFGPSINMRVHTAVNRLCSQACAGQPLTVWRTARGQRRPYLHVEDAVAAIRFVLARRLFDNRVYNVVTANATMTQVLRAIARHVPSLTVRYIDSPMMNRLSYAVSARRIRRRGFVTHGNLAGGIGDTIERLRSHAESSGQRSRLAV